MKICWQVNDLPEPVTIKMNSLGGNYNSDVVYEGNQEDINFLKSICENGAFGHTMDTSRTTPYDMDACLHTMFRDVEVLEGYEIVKEYVTGLTEEEMT